MTLQSSGSMSAVDIRSELRGTGSLTFPDATTRWLADLPSGSMTIPTHFYGKAGVKLVATAGPTPHSTAHNFGTLNFGIDFPGRQIQASFFLMQKDSGLSIPGGQTVTNITIGTAFDPSNPVGFTFPSTAGNTFCGFSRTRVAPTGTSGVVALNTPFNTSVYVVLTSLANVPTFVDGNANASVGTTTTNVTLASVAANGVVFGDYINFGDASGGFTAGVSQLTATIPMLSYVVRVGFRNRLGASGSYGVSHATGTSVPCILSAVSLG